MLEQESQLAAVFILNCFEHLGRAQDILAWVHGSLRPGGRLLIRVPNGCAVRYGYDRLGSVGLRVLRDNNLLGVPFPVCYDPAYLRDAGQEVGLDLLRLHGRRLTPVGVGSSPGRETFEAEVLAPWVDLLFERTASPAASNRGTGYKV